MCVRKKKISLLDSRFDDERWMYLYCAHKHTYEATESLELCKIERIRNKYIKYNFEREFTQYQEKKKNLFFFSG